MCFVFLFSFVFSNIPNAADYHIIIGGDFNQVQDPDLDRSSTKKSSLPKAANMLKFHADQLGLSDLWRSKHPYTKAFSLFFHMSIGLTLGSTSSYSIIDC